MAKQQTPYKMTKLSEIRPYERNPRIIPQAAVDAVAKSITAFGFRQPIVVDANGVILAGHTRYKAAQQLGLAEVPVVWQNDITDIQARGYRIADNKTAEIAAWDRDALDAEVRELAGMDNDAIASLGMSDWELQRILNDSGTVDDIFNGVEAARNSLPSPETSRPNTNATVSAQSDEHGLYVLGGGPVAPSATTADVEWPVILQIRFPDTSAAEKSREELAAVAVAHGGVLL